ncbi:hypothetical protein L226DRAFT_565510 [Lentinus tigrinus ALCF2SS1-7]|uniref:Uncharacterized protein n=1 Tax=Lentinus tigrinus ALCF2SS1-6 TaxID=1328759 RepID=A0A5C2STL2_9APHY|nr:hypothetical protein L227DRAFT_1597 [Lentinus tigrinus ALCF2SS1-6]RPD80662.1 hypothetical protein L226DRAFT_565510 [Lentinus tigrinus ALCF2SS1-7]
MPLSVGGAQLPISAYFSGAGQSSKHTSKTGSPKVSPKGRGSPGRDQDAGPPKKKRKQKENLTPQTTLKDVESRPDEGAGSSRLRHSPRQRRNSDLKTSTRDPKNHGGEEPVIILNDTAPDEQDIIDLTSTELDNVLRLETTDTRRLQTPPITPQHSGQHRRGALAVDSLPSPPLTAPDARRLTQLRRDEERHVEEMLEELDDVQDDGVIPAPSTKQVEKDLRASTHGDRDNVDGTLGLASRPRESSLALMPPPDRSPNEASASTSHWPLPDPVQRPPSTSSDKWVPSSQTQELSIPAYHEFHHDPPSESRLCAPSVGETQVVPSSQMDEIELQMPPTSAGTPDSEAHSARLQVGTPSLEHGISIGPPSPEVIESSQQMEAEIDAAWAETVAARYAAIGWSKEVDGEAEHRTPSPSPRGTQSQGYDAQDEFSSQESNSQPLSYEIRTSPLRVPSQMTESSASYDSQSTVSTPPQLRRFRSMFEGRDERGNELPSRNTSDRRRSPHIPSHHSSEDSYSYSSSLSETQPTPVRNFMAMFDTQRDAEPSQDPDVW